MAHAQSQVVLALDGMTLQQGTELISRVPGRIYAAKIHSMWDRHGHEAVTELLQAGAGKVWVDLKIHDTADTALDRAQVVKDAGAHIITVHASGEVKMMRAVVKTGLEVFAVSALTSLTPAQVELMYGKQTPTFVYYVARLAAKAGCRGLVCSPYEANIVSDDPEFEGLLPINPGIRLAGQKAGQQARFSTPRYALSQGAGLIVVGSSVTKATDPLAALDTVEEEVEAGLQERQQSKAA